MAGGGQGQGGGGGGTGSGDFFSAQNMPSLMGLAGLALAASSRGGSPASQIGGGMLSQYGQYAANNPHQQALLDMDKQRLEMEKKRYQDEYGTQDVTDSVNTLRASQGLPPLDNRLNLPGSAARAVMAHVATMPKPEQTITPADVILSAGGTLPSATEQVASPEDMSMTSVLTPDSAARLAALKTPMNVTAAPAFAKLYIDAENQKKEQAGLAAMTQFETLRSQGVEPRQAYIQAKLPNYGIKFNDVYKPTLADQIQEAQRAGLFGGSAPSAPAAEPQSGPSGGGELGPPGSGPNGPPLPTPPAVTAPTGASPPAANRQESGWTIGPNGLQLTGKTLPPNEGQAAKDQESKAIQSYAATTLTSPEVRGVTAQMRAGGAGYLAKTVEDSLKLAQSTGNAAYIKTANEAVGAWLNRDAGKPLTTDQQKAAWNATHPGELDKQMLGRLNAQQIQAALQSKENMIAQNMWRHKTDDKGNVVLNPDLARVEGEMASLVRQQAKNHYEASKSDPSQMWFLGQDFKSEAGLRRVPVAQVIAEFEQMNRLPAGSLTNSPSPPKGR